MNLSSRDRRAAILGAVGLALILFVRLAIIPWVHDWRSARDSVASTAAELADLELRIRRVLGQQRRLEELYGQAVAKPLPDAKTAAMSLFESGQKILKKCGFQASDYQPQTPRPAADLPGVQVVPLQVRGKCQLPQLAKCLAEIRRSDTLVMIDKISAATNDKSPGQLEVTIVLATLAEVGRARP